MVFESYKQKDSVVIVYTGDGKGKTSASIGLLTRALGSRWRVAYIQFIKYWGVSEHIFIRDIMPIYENNLFFYKGGKGFYDAGGLSEKYIDENQHRLAAKETYDITLDSLSSGDFNLVICDEINNAVHDGLLSISQLETLFKKRNQKTSFCLTGRNFPKEMLKYVDIASDMTKIKHHFDDKFLANKGIDF